MHVRKIEYRDGNVILEATVASETQQKRPVILVFHAWAGKDSFAEEKAIELARLGYVGCAVDLYGKGVLGKTEEEKKALMMPFLEDRKLLQKRILAYRSLLSQISEANTSQIGAIGYSFGGLCVLDLARYTEDVKAVVSFYGILSGSSSFSECPIRSKVLVFHGFEDHLISQEDIFIFEKEMTKCQADWQFHVFGGAKHAFTNPEEKDLSTGNLYHPLADCRSWHQMKMFFSEVFPLD